MMRRLHGTYRSELRETNELNFARFDAATLQRFAEADARLEKRLAALEGKWESRFDTVETMLAQLRSEIQVGRAETAAEVTKALSKRMDTLAGLMLFSWTTLLAAILAMR